MSASKPSFVQFSYQLEKERTKLTAYLVFDGSGNATLEKWSGPGGYASAPGAYAAAPTSSFGPNSTSGWHGIASVTHNGTGDYSLNLVGSYNRLLGMSVVQVGVGAPTLLAPMLFQVALVSPATLLAPGAQSAVEILMSLAATPGSLADPPAAQALLITLELDAGSP